MEQLQSVEVTAAENGTAKKKGFFSRITTCNTVWRLVLNCVLMLLVPYCYLFACGFIDKALLMRGFAWRDAFVLFVFFSLMLFWAIGLTLAIISIVKFCKQAKKNRKA